MNATLDLNRDGTERIAYNAVGFPVRTVDSCLSVFQGYAAACHWHHDLEFLLVRQGEMDYFVNGTIVHIGTGEAIFVNADRLHYGFSRMKQECLYSCLLFHPSLMGDPALPSRAYAAGLTGEGQPDFLLLTPGDRADGDPVALLDAILRACREQAPYYEIQVQADCLRLLRALCARVVAPGAETSADPDWQLLRRMIGYLQDAYAQPVSLPDIAAAGFVCRSRCCRIFRERLGMSPMVCLTRYRLEKACGLLRESAQTITEIAHACGFNGASYFSEQFRSVYGLSPRAFREGTQRGRRPL